MAASARSSIQPRPSSRRGSRTSVTELIELFHRRERAPDRVPLQRCSARVGCASDDAGAPRGVQRGHASDRAARNPRPCWRSTPRPVRTAAGVCSRRRIELRNFTEPSAWFLHITMLSVFVGLAGMIASAFVSGRLVRRAQPDPKAHELAVSGIGRRFRRLRRKGTTERAERKETQR